MKLLKILQTFTQHSAIYSGQCNFCSKLFYTTEENTLFCSYKCQGKDRSKRMVTHWICGICYKKFTRISSEFKRGYKRYFCSHKCFGKAIEGTGNVNYKGGSVNYHGYKIVSHHNKRTHEHTVIMEKHLGRKIREHENIHHINGNKLDNRIENLELMTRRNHSSLHSKLRHAKLSIHQL